MNFTEYAIIKQISVESGIQNLFSCFVVILDMHSQPPVQIESTSTSWHRANQLWLPMDRPLVIFQGKLSRNLDSTIRIRADKGPVFEVHHPDMRSTVGLGGEGLSTVVHGAGEGKVVVNNSDVFLLISF